MKINREYLCFIFCIALTMSSCPNNCNGHGSCKDSVCSCDEIVASQGGNNLMYVGADCSERSCPMGVSFQNVKEVGSVGPEHDNGIGTSRLLSNSSSNERISIRLLDEESGIILVNDMKIEYVDKSIGLFGCYDLLNSYVGKLVLYGKNVTSNEYYVKPEFEDGISVDEVVCKLIEEFSDLSLYYVGKIDTKCNTGNAEKCILTMKGMKDITEINGFKFTDGSYNFLCDGKSVEFTKSVDHNEFVFKNIVASPGVDLEVGTTCRLLAKLNDIKEVVTDNIKEDNCLYCKLPKLENPIENTNYRKITNILPELELHYFGIFDVYHKYSDEYLGKSNIYHSTSEDYYIKYDFDISTAGNYIDYKYELVESYEDISILFSTKVDDGCKIDESDSNKAKCTITMKNMNTILGLTTGESSDLTFACMNSSGTITEYGKWSSKLSEDESSKKDIIFTIDENVNSVPSASDNCNLLAKVDGNDAFKLVGVDLKDSFYYMKNNENTKIQFKKVDYYTNIYKAENIKYTQGKTGSILLCNNGRINQEVILFHQVTNAIFVSTRNNGILSGSYTCNVSRLLNDYSLINPITVSDKCIDKSSCELKWEGIPISDLGEVNINLACENQTGLVTIYKFEVKGANSPASRRLLDELTNITLQPEDKFPKAKDICHILLDTLEASDYGKELGTFCVEPSIEINKRNKQSKVYEVINYDIIVASKSYIGKLYCQLGNGLVGDAYLMGKSSTHYYILYDFDYNNNNNNNPKPNDYICILIDSYNDLSLFNEVKVLGQGNNGGVCYDSNCNIIWENMNTLLTAVTLGNEVTTNIVKPLYMVCIDRVKNVKLYEYTGKTDSSSNITFSLVNARPYPKVGDSCSLLSNLDGSVIDSNKYKSLYNSYYYKKNTQYNYPPLLDYNYPGVGNKPNIYRVKGLKLDDKSFTVGLLKCFENNEFKGTATVFGMKDNYAYIRYDFLGDNAEPVPSEYSYVVVKKYTDLSLLLNKELVQNSGDSTFTISFSDIETVIEELYPEIGKTGRIIKFACVTSSSTDIYAVTKASDKKFDFTITGDELTADTNCYMLNNFNGEAIEKIESSQYGKSPRLQTSTPIATIKSKSVYSTLNMNGLISNGLGEFKCYKKSSNTEVPIINYGISKTDPKVNYVSFYGDITDITDYYECNYTKIYNDYSFYPSITTGTDSDKCDSNTKPSTCEVTWTGMKQIIEGIGLNDKPLQFKCSKDNNDIYMKLTTNKQASTSKTTQGRILEGNENDLTLYLSEDDKDATLPTDAGYICKLYVYSNGTNIDNNKLPKIEEIVDNAVFIYSVSKVDFKDTNGIGYKTCEVNGNTEKLVFMGKKEADGNRYIKFEAEKAKGNLLLIECDDKETIFNDLSLYYNITIPASFTSDKTITLTGMYPLLLSVGFFKEGIANDIEYSLACNIKGYTKYDGFKFAQEENTNNVIITYSGSGSITKESECHLLSKFDGTVIKDETDSDYVKSIIIKPEKPFGGRNIYIVKNLKNIDIKIGELKCINKNTNILLGTAYLMGNTTDNENNKNYYIDYSFTSTPTPYAYNCTKQKEYKDLSLLYEIVYNGNVISLSNISSILPSIKEDENNVVCKNSLSSKITVYTATYKDLKLTFGDKKPESQDKCNLLIYTNGTAVKLVDSDYGKFYGIKEDLKDDEEIVVVKVDTTPVIVNKEEIEIPSTIPSSGNALIKCYDKETNEYLGDGEILGENSNGEVIIKYYFGNADGSAIEPSLLDIVPTVIRNDYSTTRTPKIENSCQGKNCKTVWSEMKHVLMGLLSSSSNRMRNLDDNCYASTALDQTSKEISINICDEGVNDNNNNNDVNIHVTDDSVKLNSGDKLYPLVNGLGNVSPQASEAYKLLKTGGGKDIKFGQTDIANMNRVQKFLFNDVSFDVRQLYPGNTITMNVKLSGVESDKSTLYTITGVEKNYELPTPEAPRLLNENSRILANTYLYAVSVDNWQDLDDTVTQNTITVSFSDGNGFINKLIECSGAGTCDRESGECKCYNGFTGSACERMDCPNKCSNHGKCVRVSDLVSDLPKNIFGNFADEEKIFGCKCDSGYRGADCSLKECPSEAKEGVKDRDCSNNGLCDYSDGSCKCFDGYYGDACQFSIGNA